jgi:NitT/TauT family transport system substrate-binding protein
MKLSKIVVIAFSICACAFAPAVGANEKVRVAVSSASLFYASAYIAEELGYFGQEGLDVTIIDVGSGSNVTASVVGGSAEIGAGSVLNIAHGISHGQNLKGFASSIRGFPLFIVTQKGLMQQAGLTPGSPFAQRVALLKGKTAAVNDIGGSAGDFVRKALELGGVDPKSVVLINISSTPGRLAALKAKKIDALGGYPPEPEVAVVDGYGEILVNAARDMPDSKNIEYILYYSSGSFMKNKPDVLKAFTRAIAKASRMMNQNPDAARKAFFAQMETKSAGAKIDPKLANLEWDDMRPYYPGSIAISPTGLSGGREFFRVPASVTAEMLVDPSIAKGE